MGRLRMVRRSRFGRSELTVRHVRRVTLIGAALAIAMPAPALADAPWSAAGPGSVTVMSDGSSPPAQVSYTYQDPAIFATQTWTFETTADDGGTKTFDYEYAGFHGFFAVRAFLEAFVAHDGETTYTSLVDDGPANCCQPPASSFDYKGTVKLDVQPGDTVGFQFGGSNFDIRDALTGTLTVRPALDPTSTTVSCSPTSIVVGNPVAADPSTTCTATADDQASSPQSAPTGTVSFSSSGAGSFAGSESCALAATSATEAACSADYSPTSTSDNPVRADTITASYGGDDQHRSGMGGTSVSVISLPRNRSQCKGGSWQQYAVFKNQGDCVSFVATDGANQPSR
jgi:hypothetical protein